MGTSAAAAACVIVEVTPRAKLCFKYRHIWTLAVGIVIGFALMVILLAIAMPIAEPYALYHPKDCVENDRNCETVPGAENLFVKTESGMNISTRYFPAAQVARYAARNFR